MGQGEIEDPYDNKVLPAPNMMMVKMRLLLHIKVRMQVQKDPSDDSDGIDEGLAESNDDNNVQVPGDPVGG